MDLTGRVFGNLTVISFAENRKWHRLWNVRCVCGTETKMYQTNLLHQNPVSCGCKTSELISEFFTGRQKPVEDKTLTAIDNVIRTYKENARKANREFNLTKEECVSLFESNCSYCGTPPSNKQKIFGTDEFYLYSGIDRVDNNLGYTKENSKSSCRECNFFKASMDEFDFLDHCRKVVYYQDSKKFDLLSLIKDPSLVQELAYGT